MYLNETMIKLICEEQHDSSYSISLIIHEEEDHDHDTVQIIHETTIMPATLSPQQNFLVASDSYCANKYPTPQVLSAHNNGT